MIAKYPQFVSRFCPADKKSPIEAGNHPISDRRAVEIVLPRPSAAVAPHPLYTTSRRPVSSRQRPRPAIPSAIRSEALGVDRLICRGRGSRRCAKSPPTSRRSGRRWRSWGGVAGDNGMTAPLPAGCRLASGFPDLPAVGPERGRSTLSGPSVLCMNLDFARLTHS
jgi:hypothetical protein